MNKIWVKAALAVSVLLVGGLVVAYAYVHSTMFSKSLGDSLTAVLGESIELGGQPEVLGVFPEIKVTLPNAKLRTSDAPNGIQRGRLQNLQITLSPEVVFSGGAEGTIDLSADDVTIITRSGEPEQQRSDEPDPAVNRVERTTSLAEQVMEIKSRVADLELSVQVAELSVLLRNEKTGNTAHRFSDVALVAQSGDVIKLNANVLEDDEIYQQLSVNITSDIQDSPEKTDGGTFSVNLQAVEKSDNAQDMTGNWAVQDNSILFESLEFTTKHAWLRGSATAEYVGKNINIKSDLELRKWDINSGNSHVSNDSQLSPSRRLFSYELFGDGIPEALNADVAVTLGAIRMNGLPIANGQLSFKIDDGKLDVTSNDLYLLGGESKLSFQVDTSLSQFVDLKVKLEIDNAQLERIRAANGNDKILSRGTADMIFALQGAGPSPGHLVATLDGYVIASVGDAQIRQKYSTLMDVGVVSWAIDKLSLLSKEDDARKSSANLSDPLTIECASLRLYINDGRVEVSNGAIIEFPDNVLFSSGYVDLHSETLGFAFRTKSRSLFDWSAISIAKYAEVGGSLSTPSITLNAVELAKQGVKSASSMVWGPLPSLVYSLAESGVNNMKSATCEHDAG